MTQTTGEYGTALFYPQISIRDSAWLMGNLLLWDRVRRIVPNHVPANDAENVRVFQDAGIVENTAPERYLYEAADRFLELTQKPDASGRTFEQVFRETHSDHKEWGRIDIHEGKILPELANLFELTYRDRGQRGGWLRGDGRAISLYMSVLASVMSTHMRAPLTTTEMPFLGWAHMFSEPKTADPLIPVLAHLDIEWPDTTNLLRVSPDRFLKFHEKHADARRAFRTKLLSIRDELATISDPGLLADAAATHRAEMRQITSEYQRAHSDLGITLFNSMINLSCPTLILNATGLVSLTAEATGALIAAGMGVSAVSWMMNSKSARRTLADANPLAYVSTVKREF